MIILTDNSNRKTILMIKAEVVEIVAGVNVAKICLGFFFCPTITKSSPSFVLGTKARPVVKGLAERQYGISLIHRVVN